MKLSSLSPGCFRVSAVRSAMIWMLVAASAVASSVGQEGRVKIFPMDGGFSAILFDGADVIGNGEISIRGARFEGMAEAEPNPLGKEIRRTLDAERQEIGVDYEGVDLLAKYKLEGDQLSLDLHIKNKTKYPMTGLSIQLGEFLLSTHPENEASNRITGVRQARSPGIRRLHGEDHRLLAGIWHSSNSVTLNVDAGRQGRPLTLRFSQPDPVHHPVVDNKFFQTDTLSIAPGQTEVFPLTLSFVSADGEDREVIKQLSKKIAETLPMKLNWPDRRPIGTLFLANPTTGWEKNPRGWITGAREKEDVTTEEGLQAFGEALMAYADRSVGHLRSMDAQGVIVWDLEGAQFPHPITYLADPKKLALVAPEMDRFADAFFKKFRDAGFRTGITIRPTEIFERPDKPGVWRHREVKDPVQLMSDKIQYAKDRWGCTIFYLDSNVFDASWLPKEQKEEMKNVPYAMPASMITELHARHPDVLIIPEWSAGGAYLTHSAPYASVNLGQRGTSQRSRDRYPDAFSVVSVDTQPLQQNWNDYLQNVKGGDILLFRAWYSDPANRLVKAMMQEVSFLKEGMSREIADADIAKLGELAGSPDLKTRYFVAVALGNSGSADAIPLLRKLMADPEPLVQKNAIQALEATGQPIPAEVAKALAAIAQNKENVFLGPFACKSLAAIAVSERGQHGPASEILLSYLNSSEGFLVSIALQGLAGAPAPTSSPNIQEKVVELLSSPSRGTRELAVRAAGNLQIKEAVPALIELLNDKDELVAGNAIVSLGKIGDMRAVEPLLDQFDRRYQTVVVYWVYDALDESLQKISGEKHRKGTKEAWRKWLSDWEQFNRLPG